MESAAQIAPRSVPRHPSPALSCQVVLVRKTYRRGRSSARSFRLKGLAMTEAPAAAEAEDEEGDDGVPVAVPRVQAADTTGGIAGLGHVSTVGGSARRSRRDAESMERDYEAYMRELEEDPEMRADVLMYKAKGAPGASGDAAAAAGEEDEEAVDELPAIGVDELLDDLTLVDDDEGLDEEEDDDDDEGA